MFIQRTQKPNKRGFTLVELTMVMAITAIISVMIVSFSTLISAQTRKNNLRADFLESVITLRTDLQKQFAEVDGSDISIADFLESLITLRTDLQKQFTEVDSSDISISDDKIENPNFSFDWAKYEYIDDVKFEINGKIIKVTVTNDKLSESQSFTLLSKVE